MANATPPSGASYGAAHARIDLDLTALLNAPRVARTAGQGVARELQATLRIVQNEQRLAITQAQQALAAVRSQQTQVTAIARSESQRRIQQARVESNAQIQEERRKTAAFVEEERRKTAAFRAELRQRQSSQFSVGSFSRGVAGAAVGSIGGPLGAIAGAAASGGPAGIATAVGVGAVELSKAAIAADATATAYRRQNVAAVQLAGGQARLNSLLQTYREATGGTVDDVTALSNVLNLIALGFAKNNTQLEKFARASRGIGIARGLSPDTVIQQISFESMNQTGMRLDQLGLQYSEVRRRAAELRAENTALTQQQAYANAIVDVANEKFGKLADSQAGQATGAERAATAWSNLSNEIGQGVSFWVDMIGDRLADELEKRIQQLHIMRDAALAVGQAMGLIGPSGPITSRTSIGSTVRERPQTFARFSPEQTNVMVEWNERRLNIERETNQAIINETRSFQKQRAETIRSYEQNIARDAQDYARQWLNRERDLQENIAQINRDSAQQRVRWERDLAQSIAEAQRDSAERVARLERDHNERLGDYREESAEKLADQQKEVDDRISKERAESLERLGEIESEYNKERQRAAQEHQLRREELAARLDARGLYEEDKRYELESEQADESHKEAIAKEKERLADFEREQQEAHQKAIAQERENLQDRIDEENEAHRTRLSDEADALAKSIEQQQAAHQQRLADQVANDAQRIADMQDAFVKEKAQSDAERGERLRRQAEDHRAQLTELNNAHQDRLIQIGEHAREERELLDEKFKESLNALGVKVDGYTEEIDRITNSAIANAVRFLKGVSEAQELVTERNQIQQRLPTLIPGSSEWVNLQYRLNEIDARLKEITNGSAKVDTSGVASVSVSAAWSSVPSGAQYAFPVASSSSVSNSDSVSVSIAPGAIVVNGAPGQSEEQLAAFVDQRIYDTVRRAAGRG